MRADVFPCLGDDTRGLHQHADAIESGIDLDRVLRTDPVAIGRVAVPSVDAALGVTAVAAHVPLTDRAVRARDRIGPAHDADDQIAGRQAATARRVDDASERLVPEDQAFGARRRRAVVAVHDLDVGAAYADSQRLDEDGTVVGRRLRNIVESDRVGLTGHHRDRSHGIILTAPGDGRSSRCSRRLIG